MTLSVQKSFQIYECFKFAVKTIEPKFFSSFHGPEHSNRSDILLSLPWATLAAFQIEIALKHLVTISGTMPPKVHNLEKLFGLLPLENSDPIRAKLNDFNFDSEMKKVSNMFIHARYLTEDGETYLPIFLKSLRDAVEIEMRSDELKGINVYRGVNGEWREVS
ncbi:hypothetical protein GCM10011309_08140 [Litorimonas cladophorae]|uniref:HEPN domain-containing protein n=1 Tax=Litorimonas cladophorae TaxID=1220491 RepID=A0A918KEF1_9PROT|nr:hypothetical protein [Litorimonas cladophorae]GGX60675.1 hypothetical protein GCM10011309_08140 [Litorimonas cladophorae]